MRKLKPLLLIVLFTGLIFQPSNATAQSNSLQSSLTHTNQQNVVDDDDKDDDENDLPLEPARTVSFTTHEGSWISLDVHPSGEKIVFDMMGNLYTIPIEGGHATQITEGMAWVTHPRYSPNGEYILFISDRSGGNNVWYMDVDTGEMFQVTHGKNNRIPSAVWSPSGKYIVASIRKNDGNKLWLFHRDGGTGMKLVDEPDNLKMIDPFFHPNGRYIYYSRRTDSWNYNAQLPEYQIGVYDRKTGETSVITSRYGSAFTPTISPNGKWMVYGTRFEDQTGLVIRNLKTGEEHWLAYPVQHDAQESIAAVGVYPGFSFTPNSQAVIVFYGGHIWRVPVDGGSPEKIPFTVEVDLKIGPRLEFDYPIKDKKTKIATEIRNAVPSPDGDMLAFTALNRLYVMEIPNGEPHRVTNMDVIEANPAWSPNGEWIVYSTWDPDKGGYLYKVRPGGGKPIRLTKRSAIYGDPAWSFNSNRIVFLMGSAQSFKYRTGPSAYYSSMNKIAWIPEKGGKIHVIGRAAGRTNPHFVKYNDRIYMNDGNMLISMNWQGTDIREIVEVTGITTSTFFAAHGGQSHLGHGKPQAGGVEPSEASIITAAPKGNWALAKINTSVYAFMLPEVGKTLEINLANPENAPFPARKLTQIGGNYPVWSDDGNEIHWSLGNAHFVYDLEKALAVTDRIEVSDDNKKQEEGEENDEGDEEPAYQPEKFIVKVTYEQDIPNGTLLLKDARLITMDGYEVIEHGSILIKDNRIAAVGKTGTLDVPAEADVMDMSGKTIIPGFVDVHAHVWPTWGIHKNEVWKFWANLAYGVTTLRDPQTATTDIFTYSNLVDAGRMIGPRIYSTGPGLGYWAYDIQSLEQAQEVMKLYSKYYDTNYIKMYIAGNRKQRQWIVMAAKDQKITPTTEGALNFKLNMTQLIDGYPNQEHNLPIYPLYKDVVETVSQAKMGITPTFIVDYGGPWAENYFYTKYTPYDNQKLQYFTPYSKLAPKTRRRGFWAMEEEYAFKEQSKFYKKLMEAGGLVGIGSHGQLQGLGYHWELWAVASGEMSNHMALRIATIVGAKRLGLAQDIGSIEEGKLADLVILKKNPLKDLHNTLSIKYVMKNGRLYEAATLDEVWPRNKPAPDRWWVENKPTEVPLPGIKESSNARAYSK